MAPAFLPVCANTTLNNLALRWSAIFAAIIALFFIDAPQANAGNTWDGGGVDGNWGTGDNWEPNGAPGYGTLTFSGSTRTENTNNSITGMNMLLWTNTSSSWTLRSSGSTVLSLFDFGGASANLENQSAGTISIYADITFAANNGTPANPFGEINAVSGDMLFLGGTLTVNGSSVNGIKMFSGGNTVAYDNTIAASGKWFGMTASGVNMEIGGSFTSGDIYVMNNGTLDLKAGSSLTTTAIRLGGDFGNTGNENQLQSGTLVLSDADGGYTLGTIVNSVTGNTSGSLLIDSQNASGTMTINGGIALDSNLKIQQATGGTLSITTTAVEIKGHNLQLDASGAINISSDVTVTSRTGTLSLLGGTTTLSGSNSGDLKFVLNSGSTLSVGSIGNLGAPSGTFFGDKLNLDGGTLKVTENITAAANFGITVSANGGAIDVNSGKTLTLQDFITDGSATGQTLTKSGSGTLFFDKTGVNGLDGTTLLISEGVVTTYNPGAMAPTIQLGSSTVATSGTYNFTKNDGPVTANNNFTVNSGGGAISVTDDTLTLGGTLGGSGAFSKTSAGNLTLTGNNGYNGALTVSEGTLQLNRTGGASLGSVDSISVANTATLLISQTSQVNNDQVEVTLSGGTIQRATGVSEVFGALSIDSNSTLNFGDGTAGNLTFGVYEAGSQPTHKLTVNNFFSANTLVFGSDLSSYISSSYSGTSFTSTYFDINSTSGGFTSNWNGSTFTITAIPEPSTYLAAAGLFALFLWPICRRLLKDAKFLRGLRPTGRA